MNIHATPHVYGDLMSLMFVLTLADGLCSCVVYTSYLVLVPVPGDSN
jgi:hypothetical protein